MKTFLIILKDKQREKSSPELIRAHVEFLKQLKKDGHLILCGPLANGRNGLIIIEADTINQAKQLIAHDPFLQTGFCQGYDIEEFFPANESNNWLLDS